jgi:hypothetical protein
LTLGIIVQCHDWNLTFVWFTPFFFSSWDS